MQLNVLYNASFFFSTFLASECVLRYIWVCDINIMHIWCLLPLHLTQEQWAESWYRAAFCAVSYFSWFKMLLVSYQCGYGILIATLRKTIGAVVQVRLASGLQSWPLHHHAIRERLCHICVAYCVASICEVLLVQWPWWVSQRTTPFSPTVTKTSAFVFSLYFAMAVCSSDEQSPVGIRFLRRFLVLCGITSHYNRNIHFFLFLWAWKYPLALNLWSRYLRANMVHIFKCL